MQSSKNKAGLAVLISDYFVSHAPEKMTDGTCITLAGGFQEGEKVQTVDRAGVIDVPDLHSTQEEADTRMILHAVKLTATGSYARITIRSDDTDVLMLLLYYKSLGKLGPDVYMHAGHRKDTFQ